MRIALRPLPRDEGDLVRHLQVLPEQLDFVAEIGQMLGEPTPGVDFHAVLNGEEAVGFFKIDRPEAVHYPFARPDEIALRGFLIGAQYQGKGYGRAAIAALPAYLRAQYGTPTAVLAVDAANPVAVHAYRSGGWADTGEGFVTRGGEGIVLRLTL